MATQNYQFSRKQAKHLNDAEFAHYAGLGLIAGIPRSTEDRMLNFDAPTPVMYAQQEARIEELETEVADLKEQLLDI